MIPIRHRIVLVSGLSGAGKSSILRALEDGGYEAVDNPPINLIAPLVRRAADRMEGETGRPERRLAIGVDARSRGFDAETLIGTVDRLRGNAALQVDIVYAEAEETVLLRRFSETRRRHPLAPLGRVVDGIAEEVAVTAPLRAAADHVIDTSELPLPTLRRMIGYLFGDAHDDGGAGMTVSLISFAYGNGLPREADLVFDARFLRNPHYDPALRALTGLDPRIAGYVSADPDHDGYVDRLRDLLALLLPRFVQEGKRYATIAVGCTGGRHRSVHVVEALAAHLASPAGGGWSPAVTHRELTAGGRPPAAVAPVGRPVRADASQEA